MKNFVIADIQGFSKTLKALIERQLKPTKEAMVIYMLFERINYIKSQNKIKPKHFLAKEETFTYICPSKQGNK